MQPDQFTQQEPTPGADGVTNTPAPQNEPVNPAPINSPQPAETPQATSATEAPVTAQPPTPQFQDVSPPASVIPAPPAAETTPSPESPVGGIVVGGGDTYTPPQQPGSSAQPVIMNDNPSLPPVAQNGSQPKSKKRSFLVGGGIALAVLLIGGAVFGWYLPNTPANAYSTGINRTGYAMDKLVSGALTQKKLDSYTNSDISGTVSATVAGASYTGDFDSKFDSKSVNAGLNFNLKTPQGSQKINAKLLSQSPDDKTYPDIYVQLNGIRTLGLDSFLPGISRLDGQWIYISSAYLQSIGASYLSGTDNTAKHATAADIADLAQTATTVTRHYIFTTDPNKAVIVKKSFVGKEKVDGVSTYHYKVGINTAHLKDYCVAFYSSMLSSSAYKKVSGASDSDIASQKKSLTDNCQNGSDVSSGATYDMWVEGHYKLIYKFRFSDPQDPTSYFDIGQLYKGGNKMNLFGDYHSSTSKTDGKMTLQTDFDKDTTAGTLSIASTDASNPFNVNMTLNARPLSAPVDITKPANSINLETILGQFGINPGTSGGGSAYAGTQDKAKDTKRQTDIQSLQVQLEAYFQANNNYPSRAEMNSSSWRASNMKSLDTSALQDPEGTSKSLAATPGAKVYAYQPLTAAGASCESDSSTCAEYTLTATLSTGSTYVKKNLD